MSRGQSSSCRIRVEMESNHNRTGLFFKIACLTALLLVFLPAGPARAECGAPLGNPGGVWDSDKAWQDLSQALDYEGEVLFVSASYHKSEILREFKIMCYRLDNISRVYDLLAEAGVDQPGYESWEDNQIIYTPTDVVADDGSAGWLSHVGRAAPAPGESAATLTGHQGRFNEVANTLSGWTALNFQEPEGCTAVSLAQGSVGGKSQASVLATDGQGGLSQWKFEPGLSLGGPIVKDKLWFFGSFMVQGKIRHAYDDLGQIIAVGETDEGALVHTTWDKDDNPVSGGWLTAPGNQTWNRLSIGFGPDGRTWISAHNVTQNRLHIFEKAAGEEDFSQSVLIDPTGYGLGGGASMAVDRVSGRAYFTFGHNQGLTKTMYKDPGSAPIAAELSPAFGQAEYSTTSAYNDRVYRFWLSKFIETRQGAWLMDCQGN